MKKKKILTAVEIKHLVGLANLQLTEEELKKYGNQLEETIEYVKNLNELDTKNAPPTSHTFNLKDVFFPDGEENKRGLLPDEATKNAKFKKEKYFVVKRIM